MTTSITVQNTSNAGVNYTMQSAASTMQFANDGHTFLVFVNGDAGTPTCTSTVQSATVNQPGYNPITVANTVVTIPATGTNGGRMIIGPFAQQEYNDASGLVQIALGATTSLTVAAISLPRV